MQQNADQTQCLPLLPLRDVVVYPQMVIPLFVGREKSIQALEAAMEADKRVLLVAQREASQDDPDNADLYAMGTVADIMQLLKLPDGTVKVLIEGSFRAGNGGGLGLRATFVSRMALSSMKEGRRAPAQTGANVPG